MTAPTDGLSSNEEHILTTLEDLSKAGDNLQPHEIGPLAVKAQVALAMFAGYQALETARMTNAIINGANAIQTLVHTFEVATEDAAKLRASLDAIRKVISSNGAS
jgi:hypothetical protein